LAGEAAAENSDPASISAPQFSHIREAGNIRPMGSEDTPAVVVLFAEPQTSHSRPLQAEVEPADASKEASNGQHRASL
jgi:hypothetical protein